MAQTSRTWIWVITSMALIFIMGYMFGSKWKCTKSAPITIIDTHFFPQAVYVRKDSFIHDTVKVPYIPVNPHPQTDYDKPLPNDPLIITKIIKDTIYLDSSGKEFARYNVKFLKNYPKNPKLLRNQIAKNLLSYDFLLPDGYPRSVTYPVDLERFTYVWEMGSFKAIPLEIPRKKPRILFESYGQVTYSPFRNSSRVEIDGTIYIGKVGITAFGAYSTNTIPKFDFQIGPKIKLK